jgi:hypothetical protein
MMKRIITHASMICLVVSAAGQTADPSTTDQTVMALKALLPLKAQARSGSEIEASRRRGKFAEFLNGQRRFSLLANKEVLLQVKTEADRPNYGGNAFARIRGNNLWLGILEGKITPKSDTTAKSGR